MACLPPRLRRVGFVRVETPVLLLDAGGVFFWPRLDWLRLRLRAWGFDITEGELFEGYCRAIRSLDDWRLAAGPAAEPPIEMACLMAAFLTPIAPTGRRDELGRRLSRAVEREFPRSSDWWSWTRPWARRALIRLRRRFRWLGIVSNNDGGLQDRLASLRLPFDFDVALDSAVVGITKPDPRILRLALTRLEQPPSAATFVGDVWTIDGWAARDAGLAFRLIDPLGLYRDLGIATVASLAHLE